MVSSLLFAWLKTLDIFHWKERVKNVLFNLFLFSRADHQRQVLTNKPFFQTDGPSLLDYVKAVSVCSAGSKQYTCLVRIMFSKEKSIFHSNLHCSRLTLLSSDQWHCRSRQSQITPLRNLELTPSSKYPYTKTPVAILTKDLGFTIVKENFDNVSNGTL